MARRGKPERENQAFPHSSRVAEGWYDPEAKLLELKFVDGTHWLYEDVPAAEWRRLKMSASPGKFVRIVLDGYPNRFKR